MDWKHILPDLCRGRIESRFVPAESGLPVGASRFGGQPDVPAGFTWPVFETAVPEDETVKPRPLAFLAQFDCASLAPLDREGLLPKTGLLSFFYELGSQRWGYDPKDAGCARVYWFDGAPLAPAGFPADLPEDFRLPELGWPDIIQNNMTLECELVSRGHYLGGRWESVPMEERDQLRKPSVEGWQLLFQLDTVESGGFELMFGDCGRIYFYIRNEDLAARRFDRVWLIQQCC